MSLTYVIPDIHGRCDLLDEALVAIVARGDAGSIVTIGDYVDKGPQSRQVIDRLLLLGVPAGWSLVALKGNHDAMMVEALRNPAKMAAWIEKGGDAALASYGGDAAAVPPGSTPIASMFTPASIPTFRSTGKAKRRCCGTAIPRAIPAVTASVTSCTAMIIIPTGRCSSKGAPTWTRWRGGPGGSRSAYSMTTKRAVRSISS